MWKTCLWLAAACLAAGAGAAADKLPSPESLLKSAQESGTLLDQYRDVLRNPDASVRMSAFVQLARVDDPIVREMAYSEAFGSSDADLRALALKYSFFDRREFVIEYLDDSRPPQPIPLRKPDLVTGDFDFVGGTGRSQGTTVQIQFGGNCSTKLALDDADMLLGDLVCPDGRTPIRIDLRGR